MTAVLLHHVIDAAAARRPEDPALITDGVTHTFGEVAADVVALAGGVAAVSEPGDTVAILAPNGYAYPLAYYAVPRAGRVLLPLNQRLHPREWVSQLERSRTRVLLADDALLSTLRAGAQLPACVRTVVALSGGDGGDLTFAELCTGPAADRVVTGAPDDPAWLMYTSGTTGPPKGVLLTHRSLLAGVRHSAILRPMVDDDVFLTAFPMCHVAGYQVVTAHSKGRPAMVLARFDAAEFVGAVRDFGVTTCSLAPTMIDLLLEHLQRDPSGLELVRERLRCIGYGSAPMPAPLIRRITEILGCDLNQGYGMTELSGNVTAFGPADHRAAIADQPQLPTSAGHPGPLARLAIMDSTGALVPPRVQGEIVVRGEQVCGGYYDDPAATAAAMAHGWFHTGDLGVLGEDGRLQIVDRIKDIIVTGGENVASREVEDVLRELPGVRDVAVVGVADERWGERVCAAVVADSDDPPTSELLVAGCRERLAGFKTPRRIAFVDELPRTASGKVRKDELRRLLSS
ncbi:MAG TPA: AMP-binding protein [Frankiaceae bacterium]|jgi:acyl-CoA synthetase (AMP-forming)/AMP-acid ligase II|nr:AMP-binding protein [Frankiaceae bacterium]